MIHRSKIETVGAVIYIVSAHKITPALNFTDSFDLNEGIFLKNDQISHARAQKSSRNDALALIQGRLHAFSFDDEP